MGRLLSFDYTKPYFYMVTLSRLPGLAPFSQITDAAEPPRDSRGRARYLIASDLTMAFAKAIRGFASNSPGLWPIETFIVMPDHLHLLFHLRDTGAREALCADGRMLYLSLYAPEAAQPDNATLYRRCHEMGDAIMAALAPEKGKTP
jgi:hypothetical protein